MDDPHVVVAMFPPQPQTADNANATCKSRDIEQRHVVHRSQGRFFERVVCLLVDGVALEPGEGGGKDNVAG